MKKGISLVALIITIIVLIILTAAVVLTSVNTPQTAQLAVFYNNIATVQEAVRLQMNNNLTKYVANGTNNLIKYKWVGVVKDYTENNAEDGISPSFNSATIQGINVAKIDFTIKKNISISDEEFGKYYVDNKGIVYYEGFIYDGIKYYNRLITEVLVPSTTEVPPEEEEPPEEEPPVVTGLYDGLFNEAEGVNSPKLDTGMTAIYWDDNENEIRQYNNGILNTAFVYNDWYDYKASTEDFGIDNTESKWANAITDDGSYWVWIPRYAYRINVGFHTSTSSPIEVEFMKGKTNESTGRTSFNNLLGQGNWNIHPAFKYVDGTENILSGIWVAKYEMTNYTTNPKSIPDISIVGSLPLLNFFTKSLSMIPSLQSHLMKNSDWGAVVYLSQSKYGRNGVQASLANDFVTGGDPLESTTGNIYGIYDMNGGAYDSVAGGLTTNIINTLGSENAKYYETYAAYGEKYGDAMYETTAGEYYANGMLIASWYTGYTLFVTSELPFIVRGDYANGGNTGLFSFSNSNGQAGGMFSFRPVLWGAP